MRGEVCVSFATFLAFAAVILMIFVHVGQLNTTSVPRGISMVSVNTSRYGDTLHNISSNADIITGLYTDNPQAELGVGAGLRQRYEFGLYSHCAFVNQSAGICSNHTAGVQFRPYDDLTADMISNYSVISNALIHGVFRDSDFLGEASKAAYWMLLLGTVCAALAAVSGIIRHGGTFLLSTSSAMLGSIFMLIGASIWTAIIKKSEAVNVATVGMNVPFGIQVSAGIGLYLIWAAFAALFVSVVPYMISCCTYRG